MNNLPSRGMVIFDLDGTLTVPVLDFDAIRAEIGLPPGPILEALEGLTDECRSVALSVLDRHEARAAEGAILQPGAKDVVATLRAKGWPVAVLTRNTRHWSSVVLRKFGIEIDALRGRDDGVTKPSPKPIFHLCDQTGSDPRRSWMVGDHLFDIQSGQAAGCQTALLVGGEEQPAGADEADYVITSLRELVRLVAD